MGKSLQSKDMIEKTIQINNKLGLHARASAKFVAVAAKHCSSIEVKKDEKVVNGKSIMGVMTLAAKKGTELSIKVDGADEQELLSAIENLVNDNFGEEE